MKSTDINHATHVIRLLQGKTIEILYAMRLHPVRLSELRRNIPFASKKSLSASLKLLRAKGIIVRHDLSDSLLHVEYDFAEEMRRPLSELLKHLEEFGTNHLSVLQAGSST